MQEHLLKRQIQNHLPKGRDPLKADNAWLEMRTSGTNGMSRSGPQALGQNGGCSGWAGRLTKIVFEKACAAATPRSGCKWTGSRLGTAAAYPPVRGYAAVLAVSFEALALQGRQPIGVRT